MAVISNTSFDPLKARVNVRLQQGVPIVDADWNELDDIRKFELRAYLKWYVGDGIPAGSDGFHIEAVTGASDDFIISAGAAPALPAGASNSDIALRSAGRCIIDGLDVIIAASITYKAQTLFAGPGLGGAPQITPIPVIAGTVAAYLDVWERLMTSQEDPSLVLPGLGTESCARLKREWCVRTRAGTNIPLSGDADFVAGHSYYALAQIARTLMNPTTAAPIGPADIADLRHTGLSLSAMERRITKIEQLLIIPSFVAVPAPQFVPKSGTVGQAVDLNGRNFNVGTPVVTMGGLTAPIVSFTATDVKISVPNLAPGGPYTVTIANDGGGPTVAHDQFIVVAGGVVPPGGGPAPTLAPSNPIVPKSGAAAQSIVITGTNFDQPGLAVSFNATAATIVNSTATQITATVPSVPAGSYTVTVKTNSGAAAGSFIVV